MDQCFQIVALREVSLMMNGAQSVRGALSVAATLCGYNDFVGHSMHPVCRIVDSLLSYRDPNNHDRVIKEVHVM